MSQDIPAWLEPSAQQFREQFFEMQVADRGREAAGWLLHNPEIWPKLHARGAVHILLPVGYAPRPWFPVAIEFLRRRPQWRVIEWRYDQAGKIEKGRAFELSWRRSGERA